MAYYKEPGAEDTKGIFEFFNYVNNVAGGTFFPVMVFVIWVITFISLKNYSSSVAFTGASIITAFLCIPLAIMELISPRWMYLVFVLLAGGILWMKLEK